MTGFDRIVRKSKQEIASHYDRLNDPTLFFQVDGFHDPDARDDCVFRWDEDGDAMFSRFTYELMSGCTGVRLLVSKGTTQKTVVRLLRKMACALENRPWSWPEEVVPLDPARWSGREVRRQKRTDDDIPF